MQTVKQSKSTAIESLLVTLCNILFLLLREESSYDERQNKLLLFNNSRKYKIIQIQLAAFVIKHKRYYFASFYFLKKSNQSAAGKVDFQ